MSRRIGIIQGRLLPQVDGRIQAFPGDRWPEEFMLLPDLGYDAIELTIETASWNTHPVRTAEGRARIKELSRQHDVEVVGLCGDNFMETPLVSTDSTDRQTSLDQLLALLDDCAALQIGFVEVPMMGNNSLREDRARRHFDAAMEMALPRAVELGVDIVLESDLPPSDLTSLMDGYDHPRLGVNYDTGNSTWFGFHPDDELPRYGRHIRNVHVKDCTQADYSVPLGTGETDFIRVFNLLSSIGYDGNLILQAARQTDDIAAARNYREFLRSLIAA